MSTATLEKPNGNLAAIPMLPLAKLTDETRSISPFASETNFVAAQRVAKALGSATLVPKQFQGPNNLPNVLIAMELASRIGASSMMVMQNLYVVHGKPSWSASFLIACVNLSSRFTPLRFNFEGVPGTDTWGCRAVAKDKDTGEVCTGSLITIALAKAEGWFGRDGSKWKTMPEQMLMYRSAGFWSRVYAPELSLGMLTKEEADDSPPMLDAAKAADLDAAILAAALPNPTPDETASDPSPDESKPAPVVDEDAERNLDDLAETLLGEINDAASALAMKRMGEKLKEKETVLGPARYGVLVEKLQAANRAISAKK